MKYWLLPFAMWIAASSHSALACDEACLREKAETKYKVAFPGYLNWGYCENITMDFISEGMRGLNEYKDNYFKTQYKGPLKNTREYILQHKKWLKQCDTYYRVTKNTRVFGSTDNTKKIFASLDAVEKELNDLINGASYSTEDEARAAMADKVATLNQLVDDHKTMLHLRGRYVVR